MVRFPNLVLSLSKGEVGTATPARSSERMTYAEARVRRETGEEQRVRVPYGEGRAYRTGPESCVSGREACGEALTGERVGQVLSRESPLIQGADAVREAEGETVVHVIASAPLALRGLRPWHARKRLAREPRDLNAGRPFDGRSAAGRPEGRSR